MQVVLMRTLTPAGRRANTCFTITLNSNRGATWQRPSGQATAQMLIGQAVPVKLGGGGQGVSLRKTLNAEKSETMQRSDVQRGGISHGDEDQRGAYGGAESPGGWTGGWRWRPWQTGSYDIRD